MLGINDHYVRMTYGEKITLYSPVQLPTLIGKVPASELKRKVSFQTRNGLVVKCIANSIELHMLVLQFITFSGFQIDITTIITSNMV